MFEIGSSLRDARLRQGIDFVSAEGATKIRGKYLRALEDENFDQLPAQTYVKGFLRTYADYLGLDGQLYVDEYNSRYVSGEEEPPFRARRQTTPAHRRIESSAVYVALAAIAVVTALVIAAWRFGGPGDGNKIPNLGPASPPIAVKSPPAAKAKAKPKARKRTARPRIARLTVTAVYGDSWIEVHTGSAAGRQLYRGTLEQGQTQRFAQGRLWLNVGRPQNLRLRLNGKPRKLPGSDSQIVVVTPNGVAPAASTA